MKLRKAKKYIKRNHPSAYLHKRSIGGADCFQCKSSGTDIGSTYTCEIKAWDSAYNYVKNKKDGRW